MVLRFSPLWADNGPRSNLHFHFPNLASQIFSLEFIDNSVLGLGETWGMRGRGFETVESQTSASF
ncbi:hypothetical protein ACSS6W_010338 [Trichoderma asperelloides]